MRALLLGSCLGLLLAPVGEAFAQDEVEEGESAPAASVEGLSAAFAHDRPSARIQISFSYAVVDGGGVGDFLRAEGHFGVQLRQARRSAAPGVALLGSIAAGVGEGGHFTLRPGGGVELSWAPIPRVNPYLELLWGWFRNYAGDQRMGLAFRVGPGIRVIIDEGSWLAFEPIAYELFPPPPEGASPRRSHGAFDVAIFQIGRHF